MKYLVIAYKNGTTDLFSENQIDCGRLTLSGHASEIIKAWTRSSAKSAYMLDNYNAVLLDEVISIRVK